MTVHYTKLLRMAEQIAANISASDDAEVVSDAAVGHIRKFWDPRMRAHFLSNATDSDETLSPAVRMLISKLRAAEASHQQP